MSNSDCVTVRLEAPDGACLGMATISLELDRDIRLNGRRSFHLGLFIPIPIPPPHEFVGSADITAVTDATNRNVKISVYEWRDVYGHWRYPKLVVEDLEDQTFVRRACR